MMTIVTSIVTGLAAGILSGLLGVGGGTILIPMMVLIQGISQHAAQGISLLVIIPTALAGVWRLHKDNLVNYRIAIYLAVGAIAGALISANYTQAIPADELKKIFGFFIIVVGINTIVSTLKINKSDDGFN